MQKVKLLVNLGGACDVPYVVVTYDFTNSKVVNQEEFNSYAHPINCGSELRKFVYNGNDEEFANQLKNDICMASGFTELEGIYFEGKYYVNMEDYSNY